ncbi:hypothetical protein P3T76_005743 [Phytophthora citrophthora]|uniref:Phytanoyl-CoA dioxygenase n=1 Tax=Phytophthora citrophthora TaxID=4793 RepID=A0AAD9GRF4_9STRA|nr:hypothetical protein P3T76_005743 [Phytophthora citrophthora]
MNALDYNDVAQFWNIGYVIKNLGLDDADCNQAVRDMQHLDYSPVFGSVFNKKRDPFRLQAQSTPMTNTLRTIHESIIEMVSVNESWVVGDWHAMKSLRGGRDQGIHHDYPTFETAKALMTTNLVQASVIVALMDDTRLHVYPRYFGSQIERSARRTLNLEKGDVIFFRGGLAHAGAVYRSLNVRLHCYVCIDEVPQEPDTTEAVVFHMSHCNRCLTSR